MCCLSRESLLPFTSTSTCCVNYFRTKHLLRPSGCLEGGSTGDSYPHLTSSLVASWTEIKVYIRYSPRDTSTLHIWRRVGLDQLLR